MPAAGAARRHRFGADRRLTRKVGFDALLRAGRRRSIGGFTFYFDARDAGPPRLGIVITRKHSRLAHERNSIKRCIREAFRIAQASLGPLDVIVRPPLGARASPQMMQRLQRAFSSLTR